METVVTTMTSTESQLKELEQQALKLQQIAEKKRKKSRTRSAAQNKQSKRSQAQAPAQASAQPAQTRAPANNDGQAKKMSLRKEEKSKDQLQKYQLTMVAEDKMLSQKLKV